jgi:hypothetical protein
MAVLIYIPTNMYKSSLFRGAGNCSQLESHYSPGGLFRPLDLFEALFLQVVAKVLTSVFLKVCSMESLD